MQKKKFGRNKGGARSGGVNNAATNAENIVENSSREVTMHGSRYDILGVENVSHADTGVMQPINEENIPRDPATIPSELQSNRMITQPRFNKKDLRPSYKAQQKGKHIAQPKGATPKQYKNYPIMEQKGPSTSQPVAKPKTSIEKSDMEKEVLRIMQRYQKELHARAAAGESVDIFAMQPARNIANYHIEDNSAMDIIVEEETKKPPDNSLMEEDTQTQHGVGKEAASGAANGCISHAIS